jgi:hypothetical protein
MEIHMKKGLIILAAILLMAGCGKEKAVTTSGEGVDLTQAASENTGNGTGEDISTGEDDASGETAQGYTFDSNGISIPMNVDAAPIVKALGDPVQYFEAASCAFQGLDKIYTYNGFEIYTYPNGDKDYISSLNFLDDSVTTVEGIYLGSTLEEVKAAYGEDYTQEASAYTYTLGQTELCFIIEEDTVTAITYSAIVEGLNN